MRLYIPTYATVNKDFPVDVSTINSEWNISSVIFAYNSRDTSYVLRSYDDTHEMSVTLSKRSKWNSKCDYLYCFGTSHKREALYLI
jgi:hypothetical protein